jgi:putative ABC transport system substrate-binding protein
MRVLVLLFLVALARPATAAEKVRHVGLLANGPPATGVTTTWRGELLAILRQHGFELGKNLELVERYSDGHADRLPRLAREIDAVGADVIAAISVESVRAVLASNEATPIVMVVGSDPVAMGLVASLAHPGGRITGFVFQTPEGDAKRLQLLVEAIPQERRFGYLGMTLLEAATKARAIETAASQLNVELKSHWIANPEDYVAAFAAMRNEGVAGVVIGEYQPLSTQAPRVAASAADNGLPAICGWDYMARVGCVFGFGHDLTYAQRRVGEYAARILSGSVPSELPVEQPNVWKLTVNLKAAARLGLVIPPSILARADEVIE